MATVTILIQINKPTNKKLKEDALLPYCSKCYLKNILCIQSPPDTSAIVQYLLNTTEQHAEHGLLDVLVTMD